MVDLFAAVRAHIPPCPVMRIAGSSLASGSGSIVASLTVVAILLASPTIYAQASKLRVRGAGSLSAHASRDNGELVFGGALVDDAGDPLVGERVTVHVTPEGAESGARVAAALRGAQPCATVGGAPSPRALPTRPSTARSKDDGAAVRVEGTAEAPVIVATTDEAGHFCFRAALPTDRYSARSTWAGSPLVDGTTDEATFDLGKRALALRFDPVPRRLSLEAPLARVEVVATIDPDDGPGLTTGRTLSLADERGHALATATTDAAGRARFDLPVLALGPPGAGELRVTFAGDEEVAPAQSSVAIQRTSHVSMRVVDEPPRPSTESDGATTLTVSVTAGVGAYKVDDGTLEAYVGGQLVGAAAVRAGVASLVLAVSAAGPDALVRLHYASNASWFEPSADTFVPVAVRSPDRLVRLTTLTGFLLVLAFFAMGRRAADRRKHAVRAVAHDALDEAPPGRAELVTVTTSNDGDLVGRIVDAHDLRAIAGAKVWIEHGTFEGATTVADTQTDAKGRFALPSVWTREAAQGERRIVVDAPLHERLARALPPPGEVAIALVARKRAVLARLVAWARRSGPPFDERSDPTPGEVAGVTSDPSASRWAREIEGAVFGRGQVDAAVQERLDALAPERTTTGKIAVQTSMVPGHDSNETR